MKIRNVFEYAGFCGSLLCLAVFVGGNKACQEDYQLGSQINVTPSATPTETPDGGEDVVTKTPTPTVTATNTATVAITISSTPTASPTATTGLASTFLGELARAGDGAAQAGVGLGGAGVASSKTLAEPKAQAADTRQASDAGNWLGNSFSGGAADSNLDSDKDGFTDELESNYGSDSSDPEDTPLGPKTRLANRLRGVDSDMDGVKDIDEQRFGLAGNLKDTDGDGCADGAEALSGSDPSKSDSRPVPDQDRDCLSDSVETQFHTNPANADSDGDGLRDDDEIAIGANSLNSDTDGDGILDGKEFALNGDPVVAEPE